ncbi:MAG: TIGR01777 family oxidoreductase [Salibacteraceae bacterium]
MSKVLITGGSGLIGMELSKTLADQGVEVLHLSRKVTGNEVYPTYKWDLDAGTMDAAALKGVSSIIHLAGASVADEKWTEERKQVILESRTSTARLLLETCKKNNIRLKNFISASAIGWYPLIVSKEKMDESSPRGEGFLADVCDEWERMADTFQEVADNVSKISIGMVLAKDSGALAQIERPIRYYVGAGLGSGKQYIPWIHLKDVCNIFAFVHKHNLSGIFNAVGPEHATNQDFMQTLADVMDKPLILPNIPEFVIRMIFGESAEMVLNGVPLSSAKIQKAGFQFDYPTLNSSLFDIYWSNTIKPGV